jgi:hypothetical protein
VSAVEHALRKLSDIIRRQRGIGMQPEAGEFCLYEILGGLYSIAMFIDTPPAGCQYPYDLRRTLNKFVDSTRSGSVVDSAGAAGS